MYTLLLVTLAALSQAAPKSILLPPTRDRDFVLRVKDSQDPRFVNWSAFLPSDAPRVAMQVAPAAANTRMWGYYAADPNKVFHNESALELYRAGPRKGTKYSAALYGATAGSESEAIVGLAAASSAAAEWGIRYDGKTGILTHARENATHGFVVCQAAVNPGPTVYPLNFGRKDGSCSPVSLETVWYDPQPKA